MVSKVEQQVTMLITKRNRTDYQYNAQILTVIPAVRDSLIIHYGLEEYSDKIIWPTVDLFIDEEKVLQLIIMGMVQDNTLDIAFRPTMTTVIPFDIVLDQNIDTLIQYYEFHEAVVDDDLGIVDAIDSPTTTVH